MWTLLFSLAAMMNGYFAVIYWPSPMAFFSAGFCLWMILNAIKSIF